MLGASSAAVGPEVGGHVIAIVAGLHRCPTASVIGSSTLATVTEGFMVVRQLAGANMPLIGRVSEFKYWPSPMGINTYAAQGGSQSASTTSLDLAKSALSPHYSALKPFVRPASERAFCFFARRSRGLRTDEQRHRTYPADLPSRQRRAAPLSDPLGRAYGARAWARHRHSDCRREPQRHRGAWRLLRSLPGACGIGRRAQPDFASRLHQYRACHRHRPASAMGGPGPHRLARPWGHRVAADFREELAEGVDIRPTIAVTKARLTIPELNDAVAAGRLAWTARWWVMRETLR